ncbi:MAG TPA: SMC-Scp complex subunit ScpB [Gemmataceae bacterium]|nr:SMC-Scp complex subunit ScpB [Gemmataceae bacterium]
MTPLNTNDGPSTLREKPADPPPLMRIVEALLFVGGEPLTAERARSAIRGLTAAEFTKVLDELNQTYRAESRPCLIEPKGNGFVLNLRPSFRSIPEKLFGATRHARLSSVALDVLALVAYRQPATREEIDSLRGVDSGSVLRQLVKRGLVAVVQRGDSVQREVAYGTTQRFLDLFNLKSLEELPRTQDLQQL